LSAWQQKWEKPTIFGGSTYLSTYAGWNHVVALSNDQQNGALCTSKMSAWSRRHEFENNSRIYKVRGAIKRYISLSEHCREPWRVISMIHFFQKKKSTMIPGRALGLFRSANSLGRPTARMKSGAIPNMPLTWSIVAQNRRRGLNPAAMAVS
jgi:hypothetical protein